MCNFVHLHTHTINSFFDGCCKIEHLFNKAKRDEMKALAITDHHNVLSWFTMEKNQEKYKVKAIYGIELNIGNNHITALAMNEEGIKNLIILNNLGYMKKSKPHITEEELKRYNKGIFFLTGCSKGKIPKLVSEKRVTDTLKTIKEYKDLLGKRLILEVHNYKTNNQNLIKNLIFLGNKEKLLVAPTNDCHFLEKKEYIIHQKIISINTGGKLTSNNQEIYFKTKEEMKELFPEKVLNNTGLIAEKCQVSFNSFIKNQYGDKNIPLAKFNKFDDAQSIKKILYSEKKYSLGEFMFRQMKQKDLVLEDIMQEEGIKEQVRMAYSLRGKIYKIEPDKKLYVKMNEFAPLYKRKKNQELCVQFDKEIAEKLEIPIYEK